MENSKIEWTHHTFNPWRGCTKVSAGCKHCYAETLSGRNPSTLGIWGKYGTRVVAAESYWRQPLKWNKEALAAGERRRVFCASLADVFEGPETMPADAWPVVREARARLFDLIGQTPHLDWLLLTKRPQHIQPLLTDIAHPPALPRNVWIGTSVEDQAAADERIPHLLAVPAVVRFLSCEPLLGPVDLTGRTVDGVWVDPEYAALDPGLGRLVAEEGWPLHWVIAGGESGGQARPMHPNWARSLRDQCVAAGVAFHFKQWGEHATNALVPAPRVLVNKDQDDEMIMYRVGKKAAGRMLDGRTWDELPTAEVPA